MLAQVKMFVNQILDLLFYSGDLLIVSHYTTIRCVLGRGLKLSQDAVQRMRIPHAKPIVVERCQGIDAPGKTECCAFRSIIGSNGLYFFGLDHHRLMVCGVPPMAQQIHGGNQAIL